MKRRVLSVMVCVMAAVNVASADSVQGIDIDFVTIGHAGNVADTLVMTDGTSGYGSVAYNYRIGKYEITNAQWDAFTTVAGAPTGYPPTAYDEDSYFPGANIPTTGISWYEAAQFCNYLTSGDKSLGAYQLGTDGSITVDREAAISVYGTIYVIPTENEWYKAAYYKLDGSGYSLYANGTNTPPIPGVNSNYGNVIGAPWIVDSGTQEQNGTFEMTGNVVEWNEDLIVMPYGNCRVLRSAGYGHPLAAGVGANIRGDGTTDGIGMGMEDLGFRVLQLGGPSDYDGDGIPDEEDWDDDEDGFNDWLEEIIGTDPLDEDDVPDLDNIEGTCISIIENLALDVGVEKSFITQIEKLRQSAEDVMKSINQSSQLSNRIESLYNSGQITYDDLRTLESLVMKFLPLKEGVYSYRLEDGYIIHDFLFNQAQMIEMSESAYKAQPYANWMIDKIWTIADGWGANIGRLVGRFTLAFSISNMANESLREGWSDMHVEIRSSSNEEMKWALEFLDTIVDKWKTLAIGM